MYVGMYCTAAICKHKYHQILELECMVVPSGWVEPLVLFFTVCRPECTNMW